LLGGSAGGDNAKNILLSHPKKHYNLLITIVFDR